MNSNCFSLAFLYLLLTACSEAPTSTTPQSASSAASVIPEAAPEATTYHLLDVTKNENLSKLNAAVLLSRKIDEAQLKALSLKLKDSINGYEKNYFAFYLPGMKEGSGAWATTQFTPEEEIRVLGATQAEEDSSKSKLHVDGKLIGKWYEEQRSMSGLAFYEKGDKCFLKRVFKGGKPIVSRFIRTGNTFKPQEDTGLGEYFVIQDDGTLEFVNDEGKVFGRALPLK